MTAIGIFLAILVIFIVTCLTVKRSFFFGQLIIYLNALTYHYKKIYMRPHRIVLVRHGESESNVDESVYTRTPDAHISLTQLGTQQAVEVGKKLKQEVINDPNENIYVYLSPYLRSKQTYEGISKSFSPSQIIKVREDPRLREQEWGNFLHPDIRRNEIIERKKVGDFYFRFTNGESGADVYDRCTLFLDTLFRKNMNGLTPRANNILIWTVEEHQQWRNFKNCEYCVLELNDKTGSYELKTQLEKKKDEDEE
ncbi:unnamed protein product [Adineta ricciae]|uniref:Uncharacterized protein n=1 Tax=Adineta ricciae TaxID=249248 RepID=A0A814PF14_ADIRI|nr:unnamed protein product [Adineta ricciae]